LSREVRLRPRAQDDLVERTRYLLDQAGVDVAERFFDRAVDELSAIGRMPGAGSPRVGEWAGIDGLRGRQIPGFGCAWLYFVRHDHVDVVRLLADERDLAIALADDPNP
jgi:toxin ParE1/3/4